MSIWRLQEKLDGYKWINDDWMDCGNKLLDIDSNYRMKYYFLLVFVVCTVKAYGQTGNDYSVVVNGDTVAILLTETELIDSKENRTLMLKHKKKHKRKEISEKVFCKIKLRDNDTTFMAGIVDYYDSYLIALTAPLHQKSKNEFATPTGFRRIKFSDINWMETDGKRNIMPQLLLSGVLLCIGPGLTILSMKEDFKGEEDPFPPALIPVGLGITYLGARLFSDVLTRTYYLQNWTLEVKKGKRKND